jgi:hypothetical protein
MGHSSGHRGGGSKRSPCEDRTSGQGGDCRAASENELAPIKQARVIRDGLTALLVRVVRA